jgi:hypothetical protein
MNKKSAGRPPKNLNRKIENREGIKNTPTNPDYIFELLHDNPDLYKNIFESINRTSTLIYVKIHESGMQLYATKPQFLDVVCDIKGDKVVRYFCEKPLFYKMNCLSIVQIFKILKKKCNNISFHINRDNLSNMKITLTTGNLSEIKALQLDPMEDFEINKYNSSICNEVSLTFTIDWGLFKDTISRWKQFASMNILFEKDANSPLRIKPNSHDDESTIQFHNDEHFFKLILNTEFVAVSVPVLALYNVSATILSDELNFFIEENEFFIIHSKLDEIYCKKNDPIEGSESATIKYFVELSK